MEREFLVSVDQDTCIGCGLCSAIAPEVFSFPTPKARVHDAADNEVPEVSVSISDSLSERVLLAAKECPVDAIMVRLADSD